MIDWKVRIFFVDGNSVTHVVQATDEESAKVYALGRLSAKDSKYSVFQVVQVVASLAETKGIS